MPKPKQPSIATEARVNEVADSLHAAGIYPSMARVRNALGGGSYATLSPLLAKWRQSQTEGVSDTPPFLKEKLKPLLEDIWKLASGMAAKEFESQRTEYKKTIETLEQRLATAQQEADQERSIKEQCEKTMRHQEITINRLQTIILQKGAKPAATRHRKLLR